MAKQGQAFWSTRVLERSGLVELDDGTSFPAQLDVLVRECEPDSEGLYVPSDTIPAIRLRLVARTGSVQPVELTLRRPDGAAITPEDQRRWPLAKVVDYVVRAELRFQWEQ